MSRPTSKKIKIPKIGHKSKLQKRIKDNKPTLSHKKTIKPTKKTAQKPKKIKKKPVLGTCYEEIGCKGRILLRRSSKANCKKIGGKSWKRSKTCYKL